MATMKVKVFNTTGYVFVTTSGGFVGAYEQASVDESDKRVAEAIASGTLVLQATPAPAPTPAPVETPTDPEPDAAPRPRSRNRNTEPEA